MKLNGNNLIVGALLSASAMAANAEVTAPDLNEFTAGTPAKAAEVNENFEGLKAYSESMQELIEAQSQLIAELETKAQNLETQNTALSNRTALLETQNTTLVSKVSELETADTTLSGRITQNTTLANGIGTRTTALEATTSTLSTDVETLKTDTTNLASRTTALESSATTFTQKAVELDSRSSALETETASLNTRTTSTEGNVSELDTRLTLLESEPAADENGNPYNIAVYGDGELIGYTNAIPALRTSAKMVVKTTLGIVKLKGGYNGSYEFEYYDPVTDAESWGEAYFTDDACSNPIMAIYSGEGKPMLFTENAGLTDSAKLLPGRFDDINPKPSYVIEANTAITTATSVYHKNYEGNCVLADWMASGDTYIIPIVELDPAVHGLTDSFTTISVEGYVLN